MTEVATVEILGNKYQITGNDESYLKKLAQYVDSQLKLYKESGNAYSTGRLSILTCLNLADQLNKQKTEYETLVTEALDSINNVVDKIDNIIDKKEQEELIEIAK